MQWVKRDESSNNTTLSELQLKCHTTERFLMDKQFVQFFCCPFFQGVSGCPFHLDLPPQQMCYRLVPDINPPTKHRSVCLYKSTSCVFLFSSGSEKVLGVKTSGLQISQLDFQIHKCGKQLRSQSKPPVQKVKNEFCRAEDYEMFISLQAKPYS